MARRPKPTQEMVDEAICLKADGLSNRLQRKLSEGLKKEESVNLPRFH